MNGKTAIPLPMDKLEAFCRKWQITELAIFGSVLSDDFRPDSDVDFLVTFAPEASWGLAGHFDMREELAEMFGRKVDLVSKKAIERSRNYIRRKDILSSAEVIYVAA